MNIRRLLFSALALCAITAGALDPASLVRQGHVTDTAAVFTPERRAALDQQLVSVWQRTSNTIAVAVVRSLEGASVEDFANRLFAHWGLGAAGSDRGVLLLASIDDHKLRVEVGYGLEGRIPDAMAGRLLDENVIPFFREGRFMDGLERGALALAAAAGDTAVAMPTHTPPASGTPGKSPPLVGILIFVGVFVLIIVMAIKNRGRGGSSGGSGNSWSSGGSSGGSSSGGFSGGSSGGGGASRSW